MSSRLPVALLVAASGCLPAARQAPEPAVRAVVISDLNGAYGSTSYAPEVSHAIALITERWRPHVVLVAGDMIAGQSPRLADSAVRAMWQAFDSVVAVPLRDAGIPLVATLGNHDGSAYPAHARDRRLAVEYWTSVPPTPGTADFTDRRGQPLRHAARYGDVFIAAWDATNAESAGDAELLAWLEAMLTGSEARRARHRVVLGHLPLYAVAEGRNRAGEVLARGDSLRRWLGRWGATMYVSGHHHAYYPGRRGAVELLHSGALGGGPRPLIGEATPRGKTVSLLEFHADSVVLRTYGVGPDGALTEIALGAMPRFICGIGGPVVRRDVAAEEANCDPAGTAPSATASSTGVSAAPSPSGYLITATSMAGVKLGATLGDVRRAWPAATFVRTSDGEGIALIEMTLARGAALTLWAEEDDAEAPIDWSKRIRAIETRSPAFTTAEGVRAGALITEVVQRYGPVREVTRSEIESRQYVTFERQPPHLTFRLDYTGVFAEGERTTTVVAPGGAIHSIEIALP